MVTTAECLANGAHRSLCHLPRKEHGDLPRECDVLRSSPAGHVRLAKVNMFRDLLLNDFDADRVGDFLMENVTQQTLHHFYRQFAGCQRRVRGNANQRAFQAPNVTPYAALTASKLTVEVVESL